jgi:hypothetical protein
MDKNKNTDIYYGGHLVAFIDVLGQSCKLDKLKQIEWWKLTDETQSILRSTYGRVLLFRKLFKNFITSFSKESVLDKIFQTIFEPKGESSWDHYGEKRILFSPISDSIILTFPLNLHNGLLPLKSIFGVFSACASSMLLSLNSEFAVRGAIEIGPCIYDSTSNEVYGSALSDAVKYEKDANWPRILVGPELVKYLEDCKKLPSGHTVNQLNIGTAELCLSGLAKDEDGSYFLDFLSGVYFKHTDSNKYQVMVDKALSFIKRQIERFDEKPTIQQKYVKLQEYFSKSINPTGR